jgi:hypothetical protein
LYGWLDNDILDGDRVDDRLYGGSGNDKLRGGPGGDYFGCGPGMDRVGTFSPLEVITNTVIVKKSLLFNIGQVFFYRLAVKI